MRAGEGVGGAGGEDTDTELSGLRLEVVEPRLIGLGVGARGKIVGRDAEAEVTDGN